MPYQFETERLLLRTMQTADLDDVFQIWGDALVMKYCGGASTKDRIQRSIEFYKQLQEEKGYSVYTVVLKETSSVIGVCGFNPAEKEEEAELLYHLNRHYWGKGFAAEAAAACVTDIRKNNPRMKKIIAAVDPANPASGKILSKIGLLAKGLKWFEDTQQEELYFELDLT
ncbi:GNAT family N-acetyltransferase [Bacillus sp. ISL-47]|nr:GNAT family N-acetyltransferase [Bacillus sp. ISL-47]